MLLPHRSKIITRFISQLFNFTAITDCFSGFPRFLKVLEFQTYGFKAWKVLENKHRSLKVLELNFVYGAISKIVHMRCQRQKEMALMIEGGDGVVRKKKT